MANIHRRLIGLPSEDLEAIVSISRYDFAGLPAAKFLAVGARRTSVVIETGTIFTMARRLAQPATTARLRSLAYMNGLFVAAGENDTVPS